MLDAVRTAGAVVVGHNGYHAVVKAKHRHEHEGLELEVYTENRGSGGGEGDQDLVHAEDHHRADGGHDDGGNAHGVDVADDGGLGAEALQAQLYVKVAGGVDDHRDEGGNDLAQYGSQGGAGHLHAGQTEQTEDQDGVQYDVDDGAQSLGEHGVQGTASGLEDAFKGDLEEHAHRQYAHDEHVALAIVYDGLLVRLDGKE